MKNFINKLKKTYWKIIKLYLYKRKILRYYKNNPEAEKYKPELKYLKKHKVDFLLGNYVDAYKKLKIDVYYDFVNKLYYVLYDNKKLYFKRGLTKRNIIKIFRTLLSEQDALSPHSYQSPDFYINNGEILFDIGAAEGFFALSVIDKVDKVYLFEYDEKWIEALYLTFKPYKHKVIIVSKFVSDIISNNSISIDNFVQNIDLLPTFIKIDVEGNEYKVLKGMENVLSLNNKIRISVCTYHNLNDAEILESFLSEKNFSINYSHNFMLYFRNTKTINIPYFVKGVLHAEKVSK